MKFLKILGLFCSVVACNTGPEQIVESRLQKRTGEKLDQYLKALTELDKFNGVFEAYAGDTLIISKAYNLQDSSTASTWVSTNHQFDIHSISKLMAQYIMLQLQQSGHISLNDKLNKYYPNFPNGEKMTIEMLLNHRSGLPRELSNLEKTEFLLSPDEIVEQAKNEPLLFHPGQGKQYSNVAYELVYDIISKQYEMPFARCVEELIFKPLKMQQSGAHFYAENKNLKLPVKNHVFKDSLVTEVPNILQDEFKTARLYSTAADLNKFLFHLNQQDFKKGLETEEGLIKKDGGSKGIRAHVHLNFEKGYRFVLLANYDEMPYLQCINDLEGILNSEEVELPKAINRKAIVVAEKVLKAYEGIYQFPDFDKMLLRIKAENGLLMLYQNGKPVASLQAENDSVFFENPQSIDSFEFKKNAVGEYDAYMGWKGIKLKGTRQE